MQSAAECPPALEANHCQHFTRSQTRLHYKAAGVLPYSFQYGVPVVLLGAELAKTGPQGKMYKTMWRDFGGQREAIDLDSETTASREFAEETMGLFGGCEVNGASVAACSKQMHAQLIQRQHVLKVVHQLKKGEYHMFIAQTPHIDPLMFHLALQQNAETDAVDGAEKTAFAWVALSDLLAAISSCAKRYFLHAHVHTTGNRRQPVVHGLRRMQLHPCFASSLRIAQGEGLLAVIAAAQGIAVPASLDLLGPANQQGRTESALDSGPQLTGQAGLAVPPAAVRKAIKEASKKSRGARGGRRAAKRIVHGITPEHMLYWVSQADIARQLRCDSSHTAVPETVGKCLSDIDTTSGKGSIAAVPDRDVSLMPANGRQCLHQTQAMELDVTGTAYGQCKQPQTADHRTKQHS